MLREMLLTALAEEDALTVNHLPRHAGLMKQPLRLNLPDLLETTDGM